MLKKEQKPQLSGLLLEENKVSLAKKSLMTSSETHICSLYHLLKVAFLVLLLLGVKYCYKIVSLFSHIECSSDRYQLCVSLCNMDVAGKLQVSL